MKAERIQNHLPEIPGWHTQAALAAERHLQLPSFLDACRFALHVAERLHTDGADAHALPQIDIRGGRVILRVEVEDPQFLDAELRLIDTLSRMVDVLGEVPGDAPVANDNSSADRG